MMYILCLVGGAIFTTPVKHPEQQMGWAGLRVVSWAGRVQNNFDIKMLPRIL